MKPHAGELHRDRRGAHAALSEERLDSGAHERARVDAAVPPEEPVLVKERRVDEPGIDLRERRAHAADAVRRGREPQERPFRGANLRGEGNAVKKGRRGRALRPLPDDGPGPREDEGDHREDHDEGEGAREVPQGPVGAI